MKMVLRTIVVSLYGSRIESGGNIAEYGGAPDQIYRARAGFPLRTVHVVCALKIDTHLSVIGE